MLQRRRVSTSTNSATVSASPTPTATATTASPDPAGVGLASASAEIQAKIDCQIIRSDADKLDLGTLVAGLDLSGDQGAAALRRWTTPRPRPRPWLPNWGRLRLPPRRSIWLNSPPSPRSSGRLRQGPVARADPEALAAANTPGVQQLSSDLSAAVDAKVPTDASAYASGFSSGDPSTYVTN